MGYVSVTGRCFACPRVFTFSPTKVPSVRYKGEREPICESCIARANEIRKENGLSPIEILPGAYEPDEEGA